MSDDSEEEIEVASSAKTGVTTTKPAGKVTKYSKHDVTTTQQALLNCCIQQQYEETANDVTTLHHAKSIMYGILTLFGKSIEETESSSIAKATANAKRSLSSLLPKKHRTKLFQYVLLKYNTSSSSFYTTIWKSITQSVQILIDEQCHIPESAFSTTDHNSSREILNPNEILDDPESNTVHAYFEIITALLFQQFQQQFQQPRKHSSTTKRTTTKKKQFQAEVFTAVLKPIVVCFHDTLEEFHCSCGNHVKQLVSNILKLCEIVYTTMFPTDTTTIESSSEESSVASNETNSSSAMVLAAIPIWVEQGQFKKLNTVIGIQPFHDIDFTSSVDFRDLLLHIAIHPKTIKCPHGRTFVSQIVYRVLPQQLHTVLRVQISTASASELKLYGDIYHRSWQHYPELVESTSLTELCYASVHGANPKLVRNVLVVLLASICSHKHTELLHRLYTPFLWRAIHATNTQVRCQAVHVLSIVFPLEDNMKQSSSMAAIETATETLLRVLHDPNPAVRIAASKAVGVVFPTYWDVIATEHIRTGINSIVTRHASDVTSAAVRVEALRTVATLLTAAPQSHGVLREVLPNLGNLLHDKVQSVRYATVQLLQVIKDTCTNIKFFHVVSANHLLARLVDEPQTCNTVTVAITKLLFNSYFPTRKKKKDAQLHRTICFLQSDPDAAAIFYSNFQYACTADTMQFVLTALRYVMTTIPSHTRQQPTKRSRRESSSRHEESATTTNDDSTVDMELIAKLTETICTVWEGNTTTDVDCMTLLANEFASHDIVAVLQHLECNESHDDKSHCQRAYCSLLRIAGWLPSRTVTGLVEHITLAASTTNDTVVVTSQLSLLCVWGMTDEVATAIGNSLRTAYSFTSPIISFGSSRRRSRRSTNFSGSRSSSSTSVLAIPQICPRVALKALSNIVSIPGATGNILLKSDSLCLEEFTRHMEQILSGLSKLNEEAVQFFTDVCRLYCCLILHKEASGNNNVELNEKATMLLHWTTNHALPALTTNVNNKRVDAAVPPFSDLNLSSINTETSFESFSPRRSARRTNRNNTPERLDEETPAGGGSYETTPVTPSSSGDTQKRLAGNIVMASCDFFAEWLNLGGTGTGVISISTTKWCNEICSTLCTLQEEQYMQLQQSFCRLSVSLVKSDQNCELLKEILLSFTVSSSEDIIARVITYLLSVRGKSSDTIVDSVTQCIWEVAHTILDSDTSAPEYELPETKDDIAVHFESGSVYSAITAVFCSKPGSLALGQYIINHLLSTVAAAADDMASGTGVHSTTKHALLDVRCLALLCSEESKVGVDITKLIQESCGGGILSLPDNFEEGFHTVVEELLLIDTV